MKKYLSMLAVVAVAASAFAQGTVNFSNNGTTPVVKLEGGVTAAVPNAGGFVELLWAPSGTAATDYNGGPLASWLSSNPGWQAIATSIKAIGPVAGRFLGGTVSVPTATPGAAIQVAVAGWEGNFASFDAAAQAGVATGISTEFAVTTGNPTTTPPGTAAVITGAGQFGGLTITAIPEPSTLALAGLGAAALLIFRRRK